MIEKTNPSNLAIKQICDSMQRQNLKYTMNKIQNKLRKRKSARDIGVRAFVHTLARFASAESDSNANSRRSVVSLPISLCFAFRRAHVLTRAAPRGLADLAAAPARNHDDQYERDERHTEPNHNLPLRELDRVDEAVERRIVGVVAAISHERNKNVAMRRQRLHACSEKVIKRSIASCSTQLYFWVSGFDEKECAFDFAIVCDVA
jgi:hypothetical protein